MIGRSVTLLFFLIAFDVSLYHSEVHINLIVEGEIWGIGEQRLREVGYYFVNGFVKCCCLALRTEATMSCVVVTGARRKSVEGVLVAIVFGKLR